MFFTAQNAAEFWSACTRPTNQNGLSLSIESTALALATLQEQIEIVSDSEETFQQWVSLVMQHEVRGKQVHDARLVATMMTRGIPDILTLNTKDFARFSAVRALHPSELVS